MQIILCKHIMLCRICNLRKIYSGFTFQWQISFTEPNIWMWLGFDRIEQKHFFISETLSCDYGNFIWFINGSIIRPWNCNSDSNSSNNFVSSDFHSLVLANPLFKEINKMYILIKSLQREYSFFHFIKLMNYIPKPQTFTFVLVNFDETEIETVLL